MFACLEALLVSGAPLAEKRDGLGFEDRMAGLATRRMDGNGEVTFVGDDGADQYHSGGHSFSVNALQGLATLDKHRGASTPANNREKAPYEGLSMRARKMQELRDGKTPMEHLHKATRSS